MRMNFWSGNLKGKSGYDIRRDQGDNINGVSERATMSLKSFTKRQKPSGDFAYHHV